MDKQNMLSQDTLQSFISDGTSQAVRDRYASLPEIAATMDFGDLDHNVVVLDTETTGFSFNHDELTQIAAARMEQGEIVEWFITFVNPGKPIPEDVAHLTDIHDSDVADAPLPADALAMRRWSRITQSSIVRSPRVIPAVIPCWRIPGSIRSILRESRFPA